MSTIRTSAIGPLSGNTTAIVDPSTPSGGTAYINPLVSFASVASTSGTSILFTGFPSWTRKITVMFQAVSTSGASQVIIRLGTSGGIVSSGYLGSTASATYSTGLPFDDITNSAGVRHGIATIANITGNSWVSSSASGRSDSSGSSMGGGSVTLSGVLTQVSVTTVNGTDTFDAGTIGLMYE